MQLTEIRRGMCVTMKKGRRFAQAIVLGIRTVRGPNGKPQRRVALRKLRGAHRYETALPAQVYPKERYYQLLGRVAIETETRKTIERYRDVLERVLRRSGIAVDGLVVSSNYCSLELTIPTAHVERLLGLIGRRHEDNNEETEQGLGTVEQSCDGEVEAPSE